MTTNPDLLTRARALVDAITPGEWTISEYSSDVFIRNKGWIVWAAEPANAEIAAFIAAAPALVRELCDACEAQAARVSDLEAKLDQATEDAANMAARLYDCLDDIRNRD